MSGAWKVYTTDSIQLELGTAKIIQEECHPYFNLSSSLNNNTESGTEVDFSSKTGGINDGEIYFVYENFGGEMGVCRGIIPSKSQEGFTVHCTDLIGHNKNNEEKMSLLFEWDESQNETTE